MWTPIAVLLAVFAGVVGGGLAAEAPYVQKAFWFDHATTIVSFLPLFFLARSWKWLICGLPGLIAGALTLATRDDLVNRWPEVTRGPAAAMIGAGLFAWLPGRIRAYRTREAAAATRPTDGITARFPNPFFLTGMACLSALPVGTLIAIGLVESHGWKRTAPGREVQGMTEALSVLLVSAAILLSVVGGIRHRRYRGRILYWFLAMFVFLSLVVLIQVFLLGILNIAVNGIFQGGK